MKKKWLWLLLIVLYAFGGLYAWLKLWGKNHEKLFLCLFIVLLVLSLVFIVVNIIYGITTCRSVFLTEKKKSASLGMVMAFKLGLIPYYVLNYLSWAMLGILSIFPRMMFLWILIFFGSIFTYLTLLATSSYEISQIVILGRQRILNKKQCLIHIILQLIFVVDVADAIYLYAKYGPLTKTENKVSEEQ